MTGLVAWSGGNVTCGGNSKHFSSTFVGGERRRVCCSFYSWLMVRENEKRPWHLFLLSFCVCVFLFSWDRSRCSFFFIFCCSNFFFCICVGYSEARVYFICSFIVGAASDCENMLNCWKSNILKAFFAERQCWKKENLPWISTENCPKETEGAFRPTIQKFHLSKIKRKWSIHRTNPCCTVFCTKLRGNCCFLGAC